jgi:MYXO-CTERM domain-containing protein
MNAGLCRTLHSLLRTKTGCIGSEAHALVFHVRFAPVVLAFLLVPARALAQPEASEVQALRVEMEHDAVEADAQDCAVACRALASMRRAADRICALDPGDACRTAQARVNKSAERVRAACPECVSALDAGERAQAPPPQVAPAVASESAPRKGGGCAGCAVSGHGDTPEAAFAAVALALAATIRRRKRR